MRGRSSLAILLALLLTVPVVGGSNSAMQTEEEEMGPCMEEPEQPCENQTVMYLWSNGQSRHWAHFNTNETDNAADNL